MRPNENFRKFFPEVEVPEEKEDTARSSCLKAGTYMVINHLARKIGLTKKLEDTFGGKNAGMKNETAGNGFTFPMIPRTKTVKREISAWWNSVPQKWIRVFQYLTMQ